jgi:hypothetical protein
MPFQDLIALLRTRDTQACVQEIATRLGLPIRISLSYAPKPRIKASQRGQGYRRVHLRGRWGISKRPRDNLSEASRLQ